MNSFLRRFKRQTSLLLVLLLFSTVLIGCSKTEEKVEVEEVQVEENLVEESKTRVITDMAGREVEIPTEVDRIFGTGTVATIALYTMNPEKIVGLNSELTELEEKYLVDTYKNLPVLGSYKGADSGNDEEVLAADPQVIISMGNIDERWVTEADEAQEKLGVPYLMVDGDLENLAESYRFLGQVFGEEERAEELAKYCEDMIEEVKAIANNIPEEEKVSVYYGASQGALTTNVTGSIHTQAIDLIGAINAADVEVEKMSGKVEVSMEQVLNWNPDMIIATKGIGNEEGAYEEILNGDTWSTIKAVEEGHVYAIPNAPFNWFDRPPTVNRIIGVKWLGNLVYPDKYNYDMNEITKEFYELFYHRSLTDEEVAEILENAIR